jgi:hypothetical protein
MAIGAAAFGVGASLGGGEDETTGFKGVSEGEVRDFQLGTTEPLKLEHLSFQSDIRAGKVVDSVSLAEGLEVLRVAELMVSRAKS